MTTTWCGGRCGRRGGQAHVRLVKRIPAGAGLGGGSSDAAAVLRWAGVDDLELAASIGADVAFCVRGGRARVRGIGEVVEPLPHEDRTFTLLTPPFGCSTVEVYRSWDALGGPTGAGRERPRGRGARGRAPAGGVARPAGRRDGRRPRSSPAAAARGSSKGRTPATAGWSPARSGRPDRGRYLPARRCQRVRFSIFLCFFLRMRLRRFLIREPMSVSQRSGHPGDRTRSRRVNLPSASRALEWL